MMNPRLTIDSAEEPVTKEEAMAFARIDTDPNDGVIDSLVVAARKRVEKETGLSLVTQTFEGTLDAWPGTVPVDAFQLASFVDGPLSLITGSSDPIEIPKRPFRDVTSIKTLDESGTLATVSSALYFVEKIGDPATGLVMLKAGETWPTTVLAPRNGVKITFRAGFGGAADVPADLKAAILQLAAHWYENREPVVLAGMAKLPHHLEETLAAYRNLRLA